MMMGYMRVSTTEQNLKRQEVLMGELGVEKLYQDKLSGKNTDRPELKNMLDYVREGDMVIVESYSRLARNSKDLLSLIETIESKGAKFISKKENIDTSTPQGRLMLIIFAGLAEFERETILVRQREGIEIAKEQGKYKGRPPKEIENFEEVYTAWQNKEISGGKASKLLSISRSTFYRKVIKFKDDIEIDF